MNSYLKYTFVCYRTECDAIMEFTTLKFPNGEVKMICQCGQEMSWIYAKELEQ